LKVIGLVAMLLLSVGGRAGFVAPSVPSVPSVLDAARFKHGLQKHRTLACAECHTLTPERIEVEGFPGHAACISCHNLAGEAMTKPRVFCGVCHEARPITKSEPVLLRFPRFSRLGGGAGVPSDFGVRFSHPAHLKAQAADPACRATAIKQITPAMPSAAGRTPLCTDCHRRTEPPAAPEMTLETGHATCFQCHCEQPVKPLGQAAMPAMYDCAQCHQLEGMRSPHLFGLVWEFRHQDHELDTRPRRKAEAQAERAPDYLCLECHQAVATAAGLGEIRLPEEGQCLTCHNGRVGLPDVLAKEVVESLRRH